MKIKNKTIVVSILLGLFMSSSIIACVFGFNSNFKNTFADTNNDAYVNVSLNVGKDISLKFTAYTPLNSQNVSMNIVWQGLSEYDQTYTAENTNNYVQNQDGSVTFIYRGITPQNMGKQITYTLNYEDASGVSATPLTNTCSVKEYCEKLLSESQQNLRLSDNAYSDMKTLVADILNFGASAQIYTSTDTTSLVNADITEQGLAFDSIKDSLTSDKATTGNLTWKTGIYYDYDIEPAVIFNLPESVEADNLQVQISLNGTVVNTVTPLMVSDGYKVVYQNFNILDIDKVYTFAVINGGENIGSYSYSLKSFAYAQKDGVSNLANLIKATYAYGKSAVNYKISSNTCGDVIILDTAPVIDFSAEDKTYDLTAYVQNDDSATISWSSSDSTIATVDENGKVTAIACGKVVITGEREGSLSATKEVYIESKMTNSQLSVDYNQTSANVASNAGNWYYLNSAGQKPKAISYTNGVLTVDIADGGMTSADVLQLRYRPANYISNTIYALKMTITVTNDCTIQVGTSASDVYSFIGFYINFISIFRSISNWINRRN